MAPAAVSRAPPRFVAVFLFEVRWVALLARFFAMAILPPADGMMGVPGRLVDRPRSVRAEKTGASLLAPATPVKRARASVAAGQHALHALELIASAESEEPVAAREGEVATGIHDGRAVADDGEHGGAGDLP